MNWKDLVAGKLISAEEAAAMVKSGDRVAFTAGREAFAIGLALAARKEELQGVKVHSPSPSYDFGWYDPGWEENFEITIAFPTGVCQDALDAKRIDFNPGTFIPFREWDYLPPADVLFTEVSTPDERGFCSFGQSLWNKRRHVLGSKLVVAEINANLIRTYGDNYIHVSDINYFVEHVGTGAAPGTGSLAGRAVKEPEPFVRQICESVSGLIKSRDTIQIGVGRTTEPLVRMGLFKGKEDLGWHSEATPPGVISLVKEGVINGKYKTINTGKVVVTSIGGSTREEMEWVSENPLFHLVDVEYLEDIRVVAAHDNMVVINQALMIDLTGQITAESLGTSLRSAAGGQIPFVFGAWLSKGGRAITILPATAQGGKASRIVPLLPEGTVVTIQRNCADHIVTEFGVASLRGKSLRQRAAALIEIAHPDFRPELRKAAKELYGP